MSSTTKTGFSFVLIQERMNTLNMLYVWGHSKSTFVVQGVGVLKSLKSELKQTGGGEGGGGAQADLYVRSVK